VPESKIPPRRPRLPSALIFFAVLMAVLIVSTPVVGRLPVDRGILVTEFLLILLPCGVFLAMRRADPVRRLGLAPISPKTAVASVLMALAGIPLTGELVAIQNEFVPVPPAYLDLLRALFTITGEMSIPWAILVFAVTPAICEEVLFRGILLRSALERMPPPAAIGLTALFFGLFHLDPYRLVGTAVLGVILGYLAHRTGSLFAPMLYHVTNNLIILLVMNLAALNDVPWLAEDAHAPLPALGIFLLIFVHGVRLLPPRGAREGPESRNIPGDRS
jgi:sodium transport system permease protein